VPFPYYFLLKQLEYFLARAFLTVISLTKLRSLFRLASLCLADMPYLHRLAPTLNDSIQMSNTFKPKNVPSDVVTRWPAMALALWKRSFKQQAGVLLASALLMKFLPAWSAVIGFLIAPSLFIVSFAAVQIADEQSEFSWSALLDAALPGALRLSYISAQFAACFGAVMAVLFSLASLLVPEPSATKHDELTGEPIIAPIASFESSQHVVVEFFHFCATWVGGVMAMVFLGLFIVVIYQGVFGVILHAQEGMGTRVSRTYGWQAWQVNADSIEEALRNAPRKFFMYLAVVLLAVICGFQSVYFSPIGLVLATYMPYLAYVAYRSIFYGRHQNVTAANRVIAPSSLVLAPIRPSYR
jgi:hypothetical protein